MPSYSLSSLSSCDDEISQLSALTYSIFAVEGCLELTALGRSIEENRVSARSHARDVLAVAVSISPSSFVICRTFSF